jgi:hypothetical protein
MLDFLLKKQPDFLGKFHQHSKEIDIFRSATEEYIKKEKIEVKPLSDIIDTTYMTDVPYNGEEFELFFSDSSNFILAKNKRSELDDTKKAHIFIFSKVGKIKMNCHICEFNENSFPVDFLPTGLGAIEHFFCNEEDSIIHELKFGTWKLSSDPNKIKSKSILSLFPAVLDEDKPSIQIKFIREKITTMIEIEFNSGKSQDESFYIICKIDNAEPSFIISTKTDHKELKEHIIENPMISTKMLVYDSISSWLSESVYVEKFLDKIDFEKSKIIIKQPAVMTIHPTLEELKRIESLDDGESDSRGRPNEMACSPKIKSSEKIWHRI